ncbi:MAG: tryptophan--tRNA ligase [Candidatus Aenigmarchaeota archaeon]|nr:tryptophan--tRNA ligase [Candidatus Aenigmarchaeota archaeon]
MKEVKISMTKRLVNKYPDIKYVAIIARNFDNAENNIKLEVEKKRLQKRIREDVKDPSQLERIKKDNVFFRSFGKDTPIKYQLKSIVEGKDIPTDSVLKDLMFMIEMKHHFIMSAHDLDEIEGELIFDLSKGHETYTKINGKTHQLKPDDIILRNNDKIIASHLYGPDFSTKVVDSTNNCLYLLWFDSDISDSKLKDIVGDIKKYLNIISNPNSEVDLFEVKEREVEDLLEKKYIVTPWEVKGDIDYDKLIQEFGTEKITENLLKKLKKHTGEIHHFLKRKIYFSHRDLNWILKKLDEGEKFHLYTGRGPSGRVHLGHLVPWIMTKWFQDKFDTELWFQMTDDEKFLIKDKSLEEVNKTAYENALDVIAVGFKPKKTHIFSDIDFIKTQYKLALKVAKKTTFSTAKAIFGFENSSNIGIIFFPSIQTVPCFLPSELKGKNIPILIPASIDQDNYWRMARDVAEKLGYYKPAQIHGRFLPSLQGMTSDGKMSSSIESTCIFTTDTPKQVKNKIMKHAFSGGARNIKEHRKYGGNPDIDVSYQWLTFFEEDDKKLKKIYDDYKSGALLTGELKQILIDKLNEFLKEHQKRREKAKDQLDDFILRD